MKKLFYILLVLLFAVPTSAATYYVKDDGNDGNTGLSDTQAWASLYKASTATSNGDKILLKCDDTWTVNTDRRSSCAVGIGLTFGGGGGSLPCTGSTPTQNITIGAYYGDGIEGTSGNKPIITAAGKTDIGTSKLAGSYTPVVIGGYGQDVSGGFTVENLDLRGPADSAVIQCYDGGAGNTIKNNLLTGDGWAAEAMIQFDNSNHLVEGNTFSSSEANRYSKHIEFFGYSNQIVRANNFSGPSPGGFARWSNGWGGTIYLERNFFDLNQTVGTYAYATVIRDGTGIAVVRNNIWSLKDSTIGDTTALEMWGNTSTTVYFYNNTIVGNNDHAVANLNDVSAGTNYFNNNIVYDTAEICKQSTDNLVQAYNNIVYSVASDIDASCGTVDEQNTSTSDPNLVDETFGTNGDATDAYLTVSSTDAIDGGTGTPGSNYYPSNDHAGDTRSGTIDIGADEYGEEESTPATFQGVRIE